MTLTKIDKIMDYIMNNLGGGLRFQKNQLIRVIKLFNVIVRT